MKPWARAVWAVLAVGVSGMGLLWLYFHPRVRLTRGVVYGQRGEHRLVMDVAQPWRANGCGVVLLMSGAWKSQPGSFQPWIVAPLLRRGYTIFAVYHRSQPAVTVMEIVEDVRRGLETVWEQARRYGVDPGRLGITGASSGGHLALMLACRSGDAERSASAEERPPALRAVAVFFPVTDLLNLGDSTENPGDGGPPRNFVKAFGPGATNLALWRVIGRELSPIYHVGSSLPPTLIIHGEADRLVPLDQSLRFQEVARRQGAMVEVIVRRGAGHGWWTLPWEVREMADWFDRYVQRGVDRPASAPRLGLINRVPVGSALATPSDVPPMPRS